MININKILIIFLLVIFPISVCAEPEFDYGFEDWEGDQGNVSPADSYVFSTAYEEYWYDHRTGTHVVTGCSGLSAYEGSYFFLIDWYSGAYNSCLGTTPDGSNTRSNVGLNGSYPTGTKETLYLPTDISSNTLTIRFAFACIGDWTVGGQPGLDSGVRFAIEPGVERGDSQKFRPAAA